MSVPGLPQEVYEVPLYSKDPSRGLIRYHGSKDALKATPGFFSFTFYFRDAVTGEKIPKGADLYLKGLNAYANLVKQVPEFQGWKVLIYTDPFSLEQLITSLMSPKPTEYRLEETWNLIQQLAKNLDVVTFASVVWPKHQARPKRLQVNGTALRPMRSRAPFDFPNAYIFIRDADTLFEDDLKRVRNLSTYFQEDLNAWEQAFFKLLPEIQAFKGTKSLLIVGSGNVGESRLYHRDWHENELLHKKSPFGIFAGFVNVTPGVPVYKTLDAWDAFVDYVDERSIRQNNKPMNPVSANYMKEKEQNTYPIPQANLNAYIQGRYGKAAATNTTLKAKLKNVFYPFSNDQLIHRIGRDEQLYLFLLMPRALDNLVIFRIDLGETRIPEWTNGPDTQRDPLNQEFVSPMERADYHTRLFNAYKKTANTGFQTLAKVKLPPPDEMRYMRSTYKENKNHKNFLEYNTGPTEVEQTPAPKGWGSSPLESSSFNPVSPAQSPTPNETVYDPNAVGGKRKKRRTLRSKIEKRKTRKGR